MARWSRWLAVVVAVAAGCGDAPELLVRRDAEPPGEHCRFGGTAIRLGPDRNADGVLDDAEVEGVEYACAAPTAVLVREDPLGPSLECPAGGVTVQTGIDEDGDGVLADVEIDRTAHVCGSLELWRGDVTAGDWSDPVKVAALRGAHVVTGSLALGVAPAELPLLARVIGDVAIGAPAAAVALPALAEIGGKLTIATGAAAVALPALVEVGGDLELHAGTGVISLGSPVVVYDRRLRIHGELRVAGDGSRIAAPLLYTVDGALRIAAGTQGALALPFLSTIGGDLEMMGAPELHLDYLPSIGGGSLLDTSQQPIGLALPAPRTIGGDLRTVHGSVTSIDLPQLEHLRGALVLEARLLTRLAMPRVIEIAGDVSLTGGPALAAVDLGSLQTAGNIVISGAPALTALPLPALRSAGRSGAPGQPAGIRLIGTGVTAIDWPSLSAVTGDIYLSGNAALQSVQLTWLTAAASLQVDGSPLLATVAAPQLAGTAPPDILISGPVRTLNLRALVNAGTLALEGAALADLSGLPALWTVSLLRLGGTTRLRDLRGLWALRRVTSLELEANSALTSLDGLDLVLRIPGHLELAGNAALVSVAGLRNLAYVGGAVELRSCPALAALALPALASIEGSLDLAGMSAVTSLSGLSALTSVGGEIRILDNSSLPAAEIQAFLTRLGH